MMGKRLANLHAIAVVHRRFPNFGLSSRSLWRRHGLTWISQQVTGLWSHFPRCSLALRAYFHLVGSSIAESFTHLLPVVAIIHVIHCDSRPAILLQDASLLLPKVEWKSAGQQRFALSFLFLAAGNGDFARPLLRCKAESYLCQQVIKKLKRSKKIMWKKPCKIASSGGVFHHFVLLLDCANDWG